MYVVQIIVRKSVSPYDENEKPFEKMRILSMPLNIFMIKGNPSFIALPRF